MATFVIETFVPAARAAEVDGDAARLRAAIEGASTRGRSLRVVGSYYVPADELAFHTVEAPSLADVAALSRAAGLTADRIVEAEAAAEEPVKVASSEAPGPPE